MGITELSIPTPWSHLSHLIDFFRLVVCLTWSESLGSSFCWHFISLWVKFKHDLSQLWHIWKARFCPPSVLYLFQLWEHRVRRHFFFFKIIHTQKQVHGFTPFLEKGLRHSITERRSFFFALELKAFIFISFPTGENHPFSWRNTTVGWQSPRTETSGCLFSVKWLRVWKVRECPWISSPDRKMS